ncbi:ATP-binding cassette domain-containing protein, partial [Desulfobulbus sp. US1]|nr:ATP-binding cassette domain-containing protein [Desulfobulbus sp. US1]
MSDNAENAHALHTTAYSAGSGFLLISCGRPILDQIDLSIESNQRLGLIGPNGSGKTTLLHLIMGLHRPTEGRHLFKGNEIHKKEDIKKLRRSIGLVFQDADDQL